MDSEQGGSLSPLKRAYLAIEQLESRLESVERAARAPIAIVGAGLRFPGGAIDLESYWQLLVNGVDAVGEVPAERWDIDAYYDPDPDAAGKIASRHGAFIQDVDQFDPLFFGISPREAERMDPQQRLLLETAWEALERAGIAADRLNGSSTGVFVGMTTGDYGLVQRDAQGVEGFDQYYATGFAHSIAAGRLSYLLGLRGPSLAVDTACSSSLMAVHLATQSLRTGECDLALAGGVNLMLSAETSIVLSRLHMMAPDGRCKAFDAAADGFVRGEGCGMVALKRLADAQADGDPILAVIRGSAVNQDGRSGGLTAPNGPSQVAVIQAALADAGLQPADVHYVEAHGTGTSLGDPIEAQALGAALGARGTSGPLLVGSVKTNLGHLEAAAGVAGLLKVALMLKHGQIPPSLHLTTPSPHIPWDDLPLVVPTTLRDWPESDRPRVAGVSSFGFSGTNAHLLLEAAPPPAVRATSDATSGVQLLPLSAQSPAALAALAGRYAAHLRAHPDLALADVAASVSRGRAQHAERLAIVATDTATAVERLEVAAAGEAGPGVLTGRARTEASAVAFLFTGQGAQYPGMGRDLYESQPVFRATLDHCAALLESQLDRPLLDVMFAVPDSPEAALLDQTAYTQPALFAVEYGLAELWQSWGVRPAAVAGHSLGEYVAACVAGVFSLEDGLRLVAARGRLMGRLPTGGTMAAIFAHEAQVQAAIAPHRDALAVAAVNGPAHTVISGAAEAVEAVTASFAANGVRTRSLTVSHAFHSHLMEPILDDLRCELGTIRLRTPHTRLFTNLSGEGATTQLATSDYWLSQTREPVQFGAAVETMRGRGYDIFLELGPHPVLSGMGQDCAGGAEATWLASLRRGRDDGATILNALGQLYIAGVAVDWDAVNAGAGCGHVDLPTYPFQRQRCWIETTRRPPATASRARGIGHPLLGGQLRSAMRETQYESDIGAGDLGYLNDHRVFGRAILPAAAFVEAGLAATEASQPHSLDDLIIHTPLAFEDAERRVVQTIISPDGDGANLQIFSRDSEGDGWSLHAAARLRATAIMPVSTPIDLSAIRARCPEPVAIEEHYVSLRERGIDLGPALQSVRQLWRGDAEALGELELPAAEAGEIGAYRIHPALLDAAIQTLAAVVSDATVTYLPIALERATMLAKPGASAACHARLRPQVNANGTGPRETLVADLTICDAGGWPLVELSGLTLKRAEHSAGEPLDRWLYEVAWRPVPRATARPAPDRLAAHVEAFLMDEPARRDAFDRYRELNETLDTLSLDYVTAAFDRLGWRPYTGERVDASELVRRLGVAGRRDRLFGRLLAILAEDDVLTPVDGGYAVRRPWVQVDLAELEARRCALAGTSPAFTAELTLLGRCGASLAEALRGDADPLQLLFPGGDTSAAERLYTDSPVARTFNEMVRAAVSEIIDLDPDRPLRVLEIGGGTGGTTAHLLPVLPAERTGYVFTDISPAFTAKAAEKFARYPFVTCRPLDIERDPREQDVDPGRYDIVLAVNVVHAVSDLRQSVDHIRRLLCPGGLLILVEVTAPYRWIDLTFGLTDGWWRFTDGDLRPDYPLLSREGWVDLLADEGFEVAGVSTGDPPRVDQALLIARAPVEKDSDLAGDWLIYADSGGVGEDLAALIAGRGGRPILVQHGALFAHDDACVQLNPVVPADFARLMREAVPDVARLAGVVYLWGLDAGSASTLEGLEEAGSLAVAGALHAVQSTLAAGGVPRLWLVTRGAQPAGGVEVIASEQAAVWGMGKAVALEHPELRPTCVDLDPADDRPAAALMREILDADDNREVALRADDRLVARLTRLALPVTNSPAEDQAVELTIAKPGTLDGLEPRSIRRRRPGHGEVEIRVRATGLNFKDVMNVLGMYPGDPGPLGGECAGTIVAVGTGVADLRVGDDVVALAGGSFRSHVTTAASLVARRPAGLGFAAAATTAIAYVTAGVALTHLGRMREGERVLIHAAAGGVGLAAVHMALAAGAEIFATAGSPEKRAFLRGLGLKHVFDSRSLEFAEDVLAATGGEGVDIVLNSLAGEFVPRSLGLLRRNGRFLELGKRDHVTPETIAALDREIAYHIIDWGETALEDPALIAAILHDVLARVADGRLPALPVRAFPLDQAEDAFRYMARARHIGKLAVTWPLAANESDIRADGYYLITGGLRGLGLEVARGLVERGARHLLLMGRGAPSAASLATIASMERDGARVLAHQGDAACHADVAAALAAIDREGRPLLGIFHCAGVLDDGALTQQTWERFQTVLAPKVAGAWLLHWLTAGRAIEHFVLFSSVAAVLGSPGQSNHSAANAYLDALAWQRRASGLPALSINWGAWAAIGAAANQTTAEHTRRRGLNPIAPDRGLLALETLLRHSPAQVAVASIRWSAFLEHFSAPPPFFRELAASIPLTSPARHVAQTGASSIRETLAAAAPSRRRDIVIDFVQGQAGFVLGIDSAQVGPHTPLSELGFDSLMAVELRNRLGQGLALSRPLPATLVFDYPSVEAIVDYLAGAVLEIDSDRPVAQSAIDAAPPSVNGTSVAAMLDDLDALSDEDVNILLAERASHRG